MYAQGVLVESPDDTAADPDAVNVDDAPDDAYIASLEPEYFDGHSTYWYHGAWRYQVNGRWNAYRSEPAQLHQARLRNNAGGASSFRKSTSHGSSHGSFSGGGHSSGGGGGHHR